MKLQDGELVKWIGENGGWCMGHVQTTAKGGCVEIDSGLLSCNRSNIDLVLVKHTLTGKLEFVESDTLEECLPRSQWTSHAEPEAKA